MVDENELDLLALAMPGPFEPREQLERIYDEPAAKRMLDGGEKTVRALLSFLEKNSDPVRARIAALILSKFPPRLFYAELMALIGRADEEMIHSYESGLWRIDLPKDQIARDLIEASERAANPNPILLLQRPEAEAVRSELARMIQQLQMPLSLYGLWAYGYLLERQDTPFLEKMAGETDFPEIAARAGIYLLKLGSTAGLNGVKAGLTAGAERTRTETIRELEPFVGSEVIRDSGYNPQTSAQSKTDAVDRLINALKTNQ